MGVTINKPGGVIMELESGAREYVPYGAPVPDDISEAQKANLSGLADSDPREAPDTARMRDAHKASINASAGPFSSAGPVPGDYGQLDEDGAINMVRVLEQWPQTQARVLAHEFVEFGRKKVIEAGSAEAQRIMNQILEFEGHTTAEDESGSDSETETTASSTGNRRQARRAARGTPPPASNPE